MFTQNGNQLKNYGMQLQNMGMQIQNFGMQMQNMMLNIGNEIQNMGIQISNIGIQIFNMGVQMLNYNVNIGNMIQPNEFKGNPMNLNMININHIFQNENNNNKYSPEIIKIHCLFTTPIGKKIDILIEWDKTVEELLKLFIERIGEDYKIVENEDIYFLYNGLKLKKHDKTKVRDFFGTFAPNIIVHSTKDLLSNCLNYNQQNTTI